MSSELAAKKATWDRRHRLRAVYQMNCWGESDGRAGSDDPGPDGPRRGIGYRVRIASSRHRDILFGMKTTVDVDTLAAQQAARVLGTRSLKDTVNAALREVLAAERRRHLASRIRAGELPAPTPEELARLRAPRIERGGLGRGRR